MLCFQYSIRKILTDPTVSIDHFLLNLQLPAQPETLYEPIRYILKSGGKRVRPKMVLTACGLCNGNTADALHAAAAVETLHTFTLLHDDIMDNADSRRGYQTVHKKWDTNTAILSGDALFAFSYGLIDYYGKSPDYTKEQYARLNHVFVDATRIVCEGQARDMEFETRTDVSVDEYMLMIEQKTATLLQASMQIGAIIAGAPDVLIQKCGEIGLKAGIAFQIQDDLLDAVGDPSKFGKKPGGDIIAGKKTYLSALALQSAPSEIRAELSLILQQKKATDQQVDFVIKVYRDYGVLEAAENAISDLYTQARNALSTFENSIYKDEINSLLDQLMIREH